LNHFKCQHVSLLIEFSLINDQEWTKKAYLFNLLITIFMFFFPQPSSLTLC
jgi:hypothetical protein